MVIGAWTRRRLALGPDARAFLAGRLERDLGRRCLDILDTIHNVWILLMTVTVGGHLELRAGACDGFCVQLLNLDHVVTLDQLAELGQIWIASDELRIYKVLIIGLG